MDSVEEKFANFKKFLIDNVPKDNKHIQLITSSNLIIFLRTLKNYENLDDESLFNHILNVSKIDVSSFATGAIEKFKRYLEYFRKVAKSIM